MAFRLGFTATCRVGFTGALEWIVLCQELRLPGRGCEKLFRDV